MAAVGEELLAHAVGIEAAHRSGSQPCGPDTDDEVADLQRGVERCGAGAHRLVGERGLCTGIDRKGLVHLVVEVQVGGEDGHHRGGEGLGLVALGHVANEPLAGLARLDESDP